MALLLLMAWAAVSVLSAFALGRILGPDSRMD